MRHHHKRERSKTRCAEGHYVCSKCHIRGIHDPGACGAGVSTGMKKVLGLKARLM